MFGMEWQDDVALVRMEAPKANAMTSEFLDELERTFETIATRPGARGAVLTGKGRAFSAGLALPVLIEMDRAALRAFMERFDQAMLRVLQCPVATVAAVNGFAVAGGCVLALMCDARVMASGDGRIGLTEVQIGIGLPASVVEVLRLRAPSAMTEIAMSGALYTPDEARALGIVDQVVPAEALLDQARARAGRLGAPSAAARAQIKAAVLHPTIEEIRAGSEVERENWLDTWFSESGQALLKAQVAKLVR